MIRPVESTSLKRSSYSQRRTVLEGHIVVVAGLEIVCNMKFCREDRIVDNAGELYLVSVSGNTNGVRVKSTVQCRVTVFFVLEAQT